MSDEPKTQNEIWEKIQELIEWNRKYPLAQIKEKDTSSITRHLERYCYSEEEYKELLKKYKEMQRYYISIRNARYKGKLTPEQEEMCREGNIRGVFGYPKAIQDLSRKYGLKPKKIDYIICKYGTMEVFIQLVKRGKIDETDKDLLADNLNFFIDINNTRNINNAKFIGRLFKEMQGESVEKDGSHEIRFFDSRKIEELIDILEQKQAYIIRLYFGFHDGKRYTQREIGEMFGISYSAVGEKLNKCLQQLAEFEKMNSIVFQGGESYQCREHKEMTPKQTREIERFVNRIYSTNLIIIPDKGFEQENNGITVFELLDIASQVKSIKEEDLNNQRQFPRRKATPIERLNLSSRLYNALMRLGITTVEQLKYIGLEDLVKMKNIGEKSVIELQERLAEILPENEEYFIEDTREEAEIPIGELDISDSLFYVLKKANINTVADFRDLSNTDLEQIKGLAESGLIRQAQNELSRLKQKAGARKSKTELERLAASKREAVTEAETEKAKVEEAISLYDAYDKLHNGTRVNWNIGEEK